MPKPRSDKVLENALAWTQQELAKLIKRVSAIDRKITTDDYNRRYYEKTKGRVARQKAAAEIRRIVAQVESAAEKLKWVKLDRSGDTVHVVALKAGQYRKLKAILDLDFRKLGAPLRYSTPKKK